MPQAIKAWGESVLDETIIPLQDIPTSYFWKRISGGTHIGMSALYRWVRDGKNGAKLETVTVGKRIVTSEEAIRRFLLASSATGTDVDNEARAELVRHGIVPRAGDMTAAEFVNGVHRAMANQKGRL